MAASSYQWTAPTNATIASGQGTQTVTIAFASNFGASGTVSVRAQNCFGVSAARTLTVYNIPGTPGTISGSANNVCPGNVLTYSVAAVPGATSYASTAATNTTILSGQGTNSITLSAASNFSTGTLSVRAVSSCGQSAARSLGLSKNPATPSAMTGQTSNLCGGGQFTYSVTAVNGATSYLWTVPTGCTIATNNGNSIVLNIPSTFTTGTVSVRAYNSCGGSSLRSVSLTRLPSTPASIVGTSSLCANLVGAAYSTTAVAGVTQSWSVPAGVTITGGQGTNSITCNWGSQSGSVSVRNVNACGQSSATSKSVTVITCIENGGSDLARAAELEAYPNPSNGSFVIRANEAGDYYLMNSLGQVIELVKLNAANNFRYEIGGLSAGIYFINGNVNGTAITERVVVTGN
jgi:hypothetical protein